MKKLLLKNSNPSIKEYVLVDDIYFDTLNQIYWYNKNGYAIADGRYRTKTLRMHRFLFELHYGKISKPFIDHKDRNRLNNQIHNLREADHLENSLNKTSHNKLGFCGIRLDKRTKRYQAYATVDGKWKSIGYFDELIDAAIAQDIIKSNVHTNSKDFLLLNVPNPSKLQVQKVKKLLETAKKRKGSSKYRGVIYFHYDKRKKPWLAKIKVDKKKYCLGYYSTEQEAAQAYNNKALELLGEKAKLNDI